MTLKKNIFANYLGQGWTAVMAIAFIPIYIRYLGVESYGLIGISVMLQAMFSLLDLGLTPTLVRELARFKVGAHTVESIRDLLRSLEVICLLLATIMGAAIWIAAPWLASSWLKVQKLPTETVVQALCIIGLVVAMRWWEQVYRGAIQGLQDLVWLNKAQAVLATIRWGGVLGVLAWVSPTIQAFFIWQGAVSMVSVVVFARHMYQQLPVATRSGRFEMASLKRVSRFAGGMTVMAILATMLTQVDKILLSKLLPLEQFAYYTLATTITGGLSQLIFPMSMALYPRFSELVEKKEVGALVDTYHASSQWMSAVIIPPAMVLAAFAGPVLQLWTGDKVLTAATAPILSVLVIGTLLNGFMHIPYMLQLAYGWSGLAVRVNAVAVAIIVPVILWTVPRYGAIGAAWVWFGLNLGYVLIGAHLMYSRLLSNQKWRWYRESLAVPLAIGGVMVYLARYTLPDTYSIGQAMINVVVAAVVCSLAVAVSLPIPRRYLSGLTFLRNI